MFLFKNNNAFTFFGFKLLRSLLTISPALENTLSEGVDVTGTHRKDFAITAINGKRDSLFLPF